MLYNEKLIFAHSLLLRDKSLNESFSSLSGNIYLCPDACAMVGIVTTLTVVLQRDEEYAACRRLSLDKLIR